MLGLGLGLSVQTEPTVGRPAAAAA
eukprot:SAG11_NODE_22327_length_408_cov_0.504854_1_plen_24_part_10